MKTKTKEIIAAIVIMAVIIVAALSGRDTATGAQAQEVKGEKREQAQAVNKTFTVQVIPDKVEQAEQQEHVYTGNEEHKEGYLSEAELIRITEEVGAIYELSPELLQAMAETESNLYIRAYGAPCKGIMQVGEIWHKGRMDRLGVTDLYEPYGNILTAADYMAELYKINGDILYALMRYNMATDSANRLYTQGKYSNYAIKIAARAEELRVLHGKAGTQ